jgi:hypothetical protein
LTPRRPPHKRQALKGTRGRIAQLVEQGIENPRVGGSTPSLATTLVSIVLLLMGCGDRCDVLCQGVGTALAECKPSSAVWPDYGARTQADFVNRCQADWDRERGKLTSAEASAALDVCGETSDLLDEISCDALVALYAEGP